MPTVYSPAEAKLSEADVRARRLAGEGADVFQRPDGQWAWAGEAEDEGAWPDG